MKHRTLKSGAAAVIALATALVAGVGATGHAEPYTGHDDDLAQVRVATAKFHSVAQAEKAGHQLGYKEPFLINGCIASPAGAMGYHWFNHDAIEDTELDPLRPEGLVYAPTTNGELKLVAVEWIVPKALWEGEGNVEPPEVMGQEMHVLNPALGWYILHAWVWEENPAGVWEDWNPAITCD